MFDDSLQSIDVGPVKVDTGNDWMDFGFSVFLLILLGVVLWAVKQRWSRRKRRW